MIAADEWHKYQESYVKYGIDLETEKERPKREPVKEPVLRVTAKEKGRILLVIAAIGICCIVIIFLQACASSINYSINTLNQEINVLEGDIDNLHVQLNSASGLDYVEEYATEQLGMIYPDSGQYVYTDELASSSEIDSYIAALTLSQKGTAAAAAAEEKSVSAAAKRLLAGPAAADGAA